MYHPVEPKGTVSHLIALLIATMFASACASTIAPSPAPTPDVLDADSSFPVPTPDVPDADAPEEREDCPRRPPVLEVPPSSPYVVQLALALIHHCALMSDGTVRCRGTNLLGELGTGDLAPRFDRAEAVVEIANVAEVRVGTISTTCARTTAGEVWCWGRNESGQLGTGHLGDELCYGTTRCRTRPARVPGIPPAMRLAMGNLLTCIAGSDRSVWCWGTYDRAPGDRVEYPSPVRLGQYDDLVDLLVVRESPVVVREGGRVETSVPDHPAEIPPGARLRANASGTFCFVLADHSARCLGNNFRNMVGFGTTETRSVTSPHDPGVRCVEAVAAGEYHTCVLHTDGRVRCWGDNGHGQTGEPPMNQPACGTSSSGPAPCTLAPILVPGLDRVTQLALGTFMSCAVRDDRSCWCWGSGLGDRTAVPIRVEW